VLKYTQDLTEKNWHKHCGRQCKKDEWNYG
jgi:hypothetical protein